MNIKESIETRHTNKILSDTPLAATPFDETLIRELMEAAYWAPFHKPCADYHRDDNTELTAIMPWRFYILDSQVCRKLNEKLKTLEKPLGKIEGLLNTADYLIQATWTADKSAKNPSENNLFEGSINNMEHIAATAAAIQNLLLTATAKGINNYWSSGGVLRDKIVFDTLGIDKDQLLLGSIFLFAGQNYPDYQQQTSKMRYRRSPIETFSRRITL